MAQDAIPDDEVQGAIADAPADGVAVVVLAVIPAAAAVLGAILAVLLEARVSILVWAEAVEILALAAALVEMRAGVEEWVSIQVAAAERVESRVAAVRVWMPASVVLDAPPVWAALDAFLVEVARVSRWPRWAWLAVAWMSSTRCRTSLIHRTRAVGRLSAIRGTCVIGWFFVGGMRSVRGPHMFAGRAPAAGRKSCGRAAGEFLPPLTGRVYATCAVRPLFVLPNCELFLFSSLFLPHQLALRWNRSRIDGPSRLSISLRSSALSFLLFLLFICLRGPVSVLGAFARIDL